MKKLVAAVLSLLCVAVPLVMTNGGPNNASISIMQLVFRFAFERFDYPRAGAVSVIISVILIILTMLYFKIVKRQNT